MAGRRSDRPSAEREFGAGPGTITARDLMLYRRARASGLGPRAIAERLGFDAEFQLRLQRELADRGL